MTLGKHCEEWNEDIVLYPICLLYRDTGDLWMQETTWQGETGCNFPALSGVNFWVEMPCDQDLLMPKPKW